MSKDELKSKSKSVSFGGAWGWLLTTAIVLVRGLQPGATPIAEWSVKSWIFMTMPIWLPIVCVIMFFISWALAWLWADSRKY